MSSNIDASDVGGRAAPRDSTSSAGTVLDVSGVSVAFGGNRALDDVHLSVEPGSVTGLIGPNGAGKSTLLNVVNGFIHPAAGTVRYRGDNLVGVPPHKIARLGVGRTFQHGELMPEATVLENVLLGRHQYANSGVFRSGVRLGPGPRDEARQRAVAEEVIDFLELESLRHRSLRTLSYAHQKLVDVGRALAMEPTLLMLDEPGAGMSREGKEDIARFILRMKFERGVTLVLIEHDLAFVRELCDRIFVLDGGIIIGSGTPAEVLADDRVVRAYTGNRGGGPNARRTHVGG